MSGLAQQPKKIPAEIVRRALEVYAHIFRQNRREDFSTAELLALLYVRTFPQDLWYEKFVDVLQRIEIEI
jgi:hypothetical protein